MKMKSLIASMCLVCLAYSASAQMNGGARRGTSYGIRVGGTFATINTENEEGVEIKSTAGIQIGALANFYINEVLSLQPEIMFIQKGAKGTFEIEETFPDFSYREVGTLELKSNYLEVPVLAKASFGTGDFNFFFTAGPTLGYWVSGKEKVDRNLTYTDGIDTFEKSESMEEDIDFDNDDIGYERLEVGASIGVGLGYKLGTGAINLDVRYGLGLTDIYETEGDEQAKNRVFGISLAYLFGR